MSPEARQDLPKELKSIRLESRQLSRAIGEAKKSGIDVTDLIERKKLLSTSELALLNKIATSHGPAVAEMQATAKNASETLKPEKYCEADPEANAANESPIEIKTASSADWPAWDAFVNQHNGSSIYHLSQWRSIIQSSFDHDCPYLMAIRSGTLVGVMPLVRMQSRLFGHFMVSLPYFNYGGPLTTDTQAEQALNRKAIKMAANAGCTHIEWRERVYRPELPSRNDKVNMWLDLPPNADNLWLSLGSKLRAQIKRSSIAGMTYEVGGLELLNDFYRVFSINMRDLGTPVYGQHFFETILREAPGSPVLVIGRTRNGKAVSAALVLSYKERMEVPWASTLREANTLNANMGLYWHMLSYACSLKCTVFDFGRSTQNASTYRFKKQWGAKEVNSYWHYWLPKGATLPKLNPNNPKYRAAIAIWQQLPVWATRILGPSIVRNLP